MHTAIAILTSVIHHLHPLENSARSIKIYHTKKFGSPWVIWMVHWTIIRTLLLLQMLCTIDQPHSRCLHSQILSYPYSIPIYHIIGLSKSVINRHFCHPEKVHCKLYHHQNMVTEPKMHLSKYQNSSDDPPKKTLSFFQLKIQCLICHIFLPLFNISGCQYHQS